MKRLVFIAGCLCLTSIGVCAQTAVKLPEQEQKEKAKKEASREQEKVAQEANVEIRGNVAYDDQTLRSQLKEQLTFIAKNGLSSARGDDAAFFLSLYYKKHGYAKVNVRYTISGNRLRLDVSEGPLVRLETVQFIGNRQIPTDKLFDYVVSPIREGDATGKGRLPFVPSQLTEGADLVQRFYVSEGFVEAVVEPPTYSYVQADLVRAQLVIHEGRKYFFGNVNFVGPTIYGGEALRGQILDLLRQPYTEARLADISRRIQSYYKTRGYYAVKVDGTADPTLALNGHVPVRVTIDPGSVYYYDGITVHGTQQLRPSYLVNRFKQYHGKPYSPETLDRKFRELTRTGLFNIVRINPTPVNGNQLRLDINVEEAKPQEFGFSIGYGTYEGAIVGVSYANRDLFGYGRPVTTSIEYTQRSYKADIVFEDPYLFNTGFAFKTRLSALTFDYDGYSKFELGGQVTLSRQFTKAYSFGLVLGGRHVEITSASIDPIFLGDPSYFVTTVGFTQTLDLRKKPLVAPRGFVLDNTVDLATGALGSEIDLLRATGRVSYYLSFAPENPLLVGENLQKSSLQKWFERSLLAFGARAGIVYPLDTAGRSEAYAIPIDERFFIGGSTTVRSFAERELGPSDNGNPIGGEYYTIFNAEYTFPIYGELLGAVFVDAGNLLPEASNPGLNDLRYGVGVGLRYNLPIGPIRLDYGVNPSPRPDEAFGAFHFSIGFAF